MAKSITVDDLDIYYGDFLAVQGVSMTVKARSVTAFIGPSGCGKSTFLRSLNRMHEVIPGACLLYTSPSPRDGLLSRMPSSA